MPQAPLSRRAAATKRREDKRRYDLNRVFNTHLSQAQTMRRAYLIQWKRDHVTETEIAYWLMFVLDRFYPSEERRNRFVRDFNVVQKINRMKDAGEWPPPARYNEHLLHMFRLAYDWPH